MTPLNYNSAAGEWNDTDYASWSYDYRTDRNWANMRTNNGSMFVWIPRYSYKINAEKDIDIIFSDGTADFLDDGFILHSAFNLESTELKGIWFAKFEGSQDPNAPGLYVFAPGKSAYTGVTMNNAITKCNAFAGGQGNALSSVYVNSHMMKSSEWGAVAYLSQSGMREPNILSGPPANMYTGGSDAVTTVFLSRNGQSCTNTAYGVYDMKGGYREYAALSNSSSTQSNFNSLDAKYKDTIGDTLGVNPMNFTTLGMAVEETYGWAGLNGNSQSAQFPSSTQPYIVRGGLYSENNTAGLYCFQSFDGTTGVGAPANCTTRVALAVTGEDEVSFGPQISVTYKDSLGAAAGEITSGGSAVIRASLLNNAENTVITGKRCMLAAMVYTGDNRLHDFVIEPSVVVNAKPFNIYLPGLSLPGDLSGVVIKLAAWENALSMKPIDMTVLVNEPD
jgi:hypothetical protein